MMGTVVPTSLRSALQRLKKQAFLPEDQSLETIMTTATSRHSSTVIRNRVSLPATTDLPATLKLLVEEEKHVTRNAISSPRPVRVLPGERGGEPIGGAGLSLPFFPPFQLKELSCLPRRAACAHSNTAQLTPDWRGQAAPPPPAECSGLVPLRPGRDAGPPGSDWQPQSARLTSSTPDDGGPGLIRPSPRRRHDSRPRSRVSLGVSTSA